MARIGLSLVGGLPDPLNQYQFELIIPTIPGSGSGTQVAIRCKSASIPGHTKDDLDVTVHGVTVKFAGMTKFTHEMSSNFVETRDMVVYNTFHAWLNYINNIIATTGNYKANYSTTAYLLLYDNAETVIKTIQLMNFFIKGIGDAAMSGESSAAVEWDATFSYDWPTDGTGA